MSDFPRTQIEHLSVSRLIVGSNWFLGWSHQTKARDRLIKTRMTRKRIAEVLEVFFNAGINAVMGSRPDSPQMEEAIEDAVQRTGCGDIIKIGTPHLDVMTGPGAEDCLARALDAHAALGCQIFMPHQGTTDALLDRTTRTIRDMDRICAAIRERGMIPGLSTHMPESVVYADETGLDVGTYIQLYNAAGFLMQVEVDWVHRIIQNAHKPVITIKPLAAGRLPPLVGLAFAWATLRDQDMVTIGTMTPDEAREVIEISLSQLERRGSAVELQETRSKRSLTGGHAPVE